MQVSAFRVLCPDSEAEPVPGRVVCAPPEAGPRYSCVCSCGGCRAAGGAPWSVWADGAAPAMQVENKELKQRVLEQAVTYPVRHCCRRTLRSAWGSGMAPAMGSARTPSSEMSAGDSWRLVLPVGGWGWVKPATTPSRGHPEAQCEAGRAGGLGKTPAASFARRCHGPHSRSSQQALDRTFSGWASRAPSEVARVERVLLKAP